MSRILKKTFPDRKNHHLGRNSQLAVTIGASKSSQGTPWESQRVHSRTSDSEAASEAGKKKYIFMVYIYNLENLNIYINIIYIRIFFFNSKNLYRGPSLNDIRTACNAVCHCHWSNYPSGLAKSQIKNVPSHQQLENREWQPDKKPVAWRINSQRYFCASGKNNITPTEKPNQRKHGIPDTTIKVHKTRFSTSGYPRGQVCPLNQPEIQEKGSRNRSDKTTAIATVSSKKNNRYTGVSGPMFHEQLDQVGLQLQHDQHHTYDHKKRGRTQAQKRNHGRDGISWQCD